MVRDVLVANPQAAKSDKIATALDNRAYPLSEEMRSEINLGKQQTTFIQNLQAGISHYKALRNSLLNQAIRLYKHDSINQGATDSLRELLENENKLSGKYQLAFFKLNNAEFTDMSAQLDAIGDQFTLNTVQSTTHQHYIDYTQLLTELDLNGQSLLELDATQIQSLYQIAACKFGQPSAWARNILQYVDTLSYFEPYVFPDEALKTKDITPNFIQPQLHENQLNIYPNPASSFFIADYHIKGGANSAALELISTSGVKLIQIPLSEPQGQKVISTMSLPSGIYYCNFVINGQSIQLLKVIITH
jgi:hypothetical protein